MKLSANEVFDKAGFINYDNHIVKVEIALTIKKIQVLGLITFGSCSTPQEIQKFIEVLELNTFRGCSTHFNESKFKSKQSRKKKKPHKKTRRRVGGRK